jgi:hypothetical protein
LYRARKPVRPAYAPDYVDDGDRRVGGEEVVADSLEDLRCVVAASERACVGVLLHRCAVALHVAWLHAARTVFVSTSRWFVPFHRSIMTQSYLSEANGKF